VCTVPFIFPLSVMLDETMISTLHVGEERTVFLPLEFQGPVMGRTAVVRLIVGEIAVVFESQGERAAFVLEFPETFSAGGDNFFEGDELRLFGLIPLGTELPELLHEGRTFILRAHAVAEPALACLVLLGIVARSVCGHLEARRS
jgi:hypothetical protein